MPIYRVEGVTVSSGQQTAVVVRADSEADARSGVVRHGVRPEHVRRLAAPEIPAGAEILDARPPAVEDPEAAQARTQDLVRRLAASGLINRPIRTIACGVLLGLVAFYVLALLIRILFGVGILIAG